MSEVTRIPEQTGVIGASVFIKAPVERVWSIVVDNTTIANRSNQCESMTPLSRNKTLRPGLVTLNINRHGKLRWPTTTKILRLVPNKVFSIGVHQNGMIWSYAFEEKDGGVQLTETRDARHRNKFQRIVAPQLLRLLGGQQTFAEEMTKSIINTLERIKVIAESQ